MNFKLTHFGTTAICLDDGKEHSIVYSPVYLAWVANGGVPLPADPVPYKQLRAAEYMPVGETLDAITKINSGDPVIVAGGELQLAAIAAHNMAVKAKYPQV